MKIFSRFALVLLALVCATVCRATHWYNHPVVTDALVILGWKTTHTDIVSPAYINGAAVPALNITAITNGGTNLGSGKFGGSFKVHGTGSTIRGYIEVVVQNGAVLTVTYRSGTTATYTIFD